jgi:hypothetical protein
MQGIYTYIPETNNVPREYIFAAILLLLFMVPISLVPALTLLGFYLLLLLLLLLLFTFSVTPVTIIRMSYEKIYNIQIIVQKCMMKPLSVTIDFSIASLMVMKYQIILTLK